MMKEEKMSNKDFQGFAHDLAFFAMDYTDEVRLYLINSAEETFKNQFIVKMLREYFNRKHEEKAQQEKSMCEAIVYGHTYYRAECLTHSASYKDVLYDTLVRPMPKAE